MQYFIVNGYPQSGKDTFIDICLEKIGPYGLKISIIDFVKKIAKECGWDGKKSEKNRKFLSNLKDLLTEWEDVPYKKLLEKISRFTFSLESYDVSDNGIVFIISREKKDIERLQKDLNAKTILIKRKEAEKEQFSNHADKNVEEIKYDIIIDNNGSYGDLINKSYHFLKTLGDNKSWNRM